MKNYGMEPFKSWDDIDNKIEWYNKIFEENTVIRWGIALKETNKIICCCGFHNIKYQTSPCGNRSRAKSGLLGERNCK
jgi:RimJ/RimL family protein N-acetyltransferase